MQILIELMAALVVWAATVAFSQFGIEVDLTRPDATAQPTVQRTPRAESEAVVEPSSSDCPDAARARLRRA